MSLSDLLNPKCVISLVVASNEPVAPSPQPGFLAVLSNTSHNKRWVSPLSLSERRSWHRPGFCCSLSADKAVAKADRYKAETFIASPRGQIGCHFSVLFYLSWFNLTNSWLWSRESGHCSLLDILIWHDDISVCYCRLISLVTLSEVRAKDLNCDPNAHFKMNMTSEMMSPVLWMSLSVGGTIPWVFKNSFGHILVWMSFPVCFTAWLVDKRAGRGRSSG